MVLSHVKPNETRTSLGNHIVAVYVDLREHIRYFAEIESLEAIEI